MWRPPAPTEPAEVTHDALCVRCGYNLRGLPRDGNCPECGTIVAGSLGHETLRFVEPGWRAQLGWGYAILYWVFLLQAILPLLMMLAAFSGVLARPSRQVPLIVLSVLAALWAAGLCIGAWLIAAPNPARRVPAEGLSTRRFTRAAVAGTVATSVALLLQPWIWLSSPSSVLLYSLGVVGLPVLVTSLIAGVVGLVRQHTVYIDPDRAQQAADFGRFLAFGALACLLLGLGCSLIRFQAGAVCLLIFVLPTALLFCGLTVLAGVARMRTALRTRPGVDDVSAVEPDATE